MFVKQICCRGRECLWGKATISRRTSPCLCRRSQHRDWGLSRQRKLLQLPKELWDSLLGRSECLVLSWDLAGPKARRSKSEEGRVILPMSLCPVWRVWHMRPIWVDRMGFQERIQNYALKDNRALCMLNQGQVLEDLVRIFQRCAKNRRRFFSLADTSPRQLLGMLKLGKSRSEAKHRFYCSHSSLDTKLINNAPIRHALRNIFF